jgi:hypothetical protein
MEDEDLTEAKRQFADRLVNHVIPLYIMNLAGLGLGRNEIAIIIEALLEAFKEDSEIMKAKGG